MSVLAKLVDVVRGKEPHESGEYERIEQLMEEMTAIGERIRSGEPPPPDGTVCYVGNGKKQKCVWVNGRLIPERRLRARKRTLTPEEMEAGGESS